MSGGVDSAVALLKAGPDAVGVTLRLWIDPNAPRRRARLLLAERRDRCARDCATQRGLPHVTLDLREEFRRAVVSPFVDGYARGETPNPCVRCNGVVPLRRAARVRRPRRRRAARDRPLRAHRRARRPPPARARGRRAQGPELHARRRRPARARAHLVPARRADEGARRAPKPRPPVSPPPPRREPGGVLPRRRRLPRLPRAPRPRRHARRRRRRERARARQARRLLALHAGPAARARHRRSRAAVRARRRRRHEHRRRRPAGVARPHGGSRCAAGCTRPRAGSRRSSATARRRLPRPSTPADDGFALDLDEPAYGVAKGQFAVLYDGDAVVGSGVIAPPRIKKLSKNEVGVAWPRSAARCCVLGRPIALLSGLPASLPRTRRIAPNRRDVVL